ncbi:MAG: hypothetical protein M3P38_06615, partial [Chloroflexota bacterium]|nr:hypothetical protein [Chloroflexota bacterium]
MKHSITSSDTALSWRDNRLNANGDTQARNVPFPFTGAEHFALTYDGLNRLTAVTGPVPETFALDGPSNVLTRSGTTEAYDKANRLIDDGAV